MRNALLAGLPPPSFDRLQPWLQRVTLRSGQVVAETHQPSPHVFFPETGVLSQVVRLSDGSTVEVNLVGYEGFASLSAYLGDAQAPLDTLVLIAGSFLRMPSETFREIAAADAALLDRLHLYTQAVLSVRACSVGCEARHHVQARLARWLLKAHDRAAADEFLLTQDVLAMMLGVSRPSVTVNALALQEAGLIQYRRGHIRVLDRIGLEQAACECYRTVRAEYDRLMGDGAGLVRR